MASLLPFEIGVEYCKAMKGARHWVFPRQSSGRRAATSRAMQ